ncbi:MAG: ABC transporter ATP-binding protein [Phototrophicaceae bacterium]|jgi:ABC-2 type transport system ATP-binding protein
MDFIVETQNLRKTYGKFVAVEDLTLQVPAGAIYGFVGPNGAGKTTTMRMLTTLTRPTTGEATINGHSVTAEPRAVRQSIGYMPDKFGVYEDMRVWEYLDFFAACYDIPERERKALIGDLLQLVDLSHRRDDMVDKLSMGMKQRLSLARTLAHDPAVLILDEPASGLDPAARVEIRELFVELSKMGKTIFFSTHILADVQVVCSHVGIIEGGKMIAQGPLADLFNANAALVVIVKEAADAEKLRALVSGLPDVQGVSDLATDAAGRQRVRIEFTGDEDALVTLRRKLFAAEDINIINIEEEKRDLESVFMSITKGGVT